MKCMGKHLRSSLPLMAAAIAIPMVFAPAASAVLLDFDLMDHPDGAAGGDYGLRLDHATNSSTQTFHFTEEGETLDLPLTPGVFGQFDTVTGQFDIAGVVEFNEAANPAQDLYFLDATIFLDVTGDAGFATNADFANALLAESIPQLEGHTQSLTLTSLGAWALPDSGTTGQSYEGFHPNDTSGNPVDFTDPPDFLMDNGHRGESGLSGWGWLNPTGRRDLHVNYQDWLFTLEPGDGPPPNTPEDPIPEPATMTLLTMGVAGLAIRRSRARNDF